ncbi:MAG: exodeoxyribonuclease VII small subunit [Parvibaculaceae bacterium]
MAASKADIAKNEIANLSFEEALAQLEKIVAQLESGNAALEDSIDLYERGNLLKAHCEARLKAAEAKVEKITLSAAGAATGTEPLDVE